MMRMLCVCCSLVLGAAACETNESLLDQNIEDNPACVGSTGFALGDNPPVFTLTDIQYTLGVLGQLQVAVTPYVQAFLPPEPLFTGSWTNWYNEPDMRVGLAKLGVMRGILDKVNLWDMYLPNINPLIPGGASMPVVIAGCGPETLDTRTIDGTCNDLVKPSMGAKGYRFGRNIMPFLGKDPLTGLPIKNPAAYSDPTKLLSPSPREVSRHLFTAPQGQQRTKAAFMNMFATSWIQFMVHDWFDHGDSPKTFPYVIPLAADDPFVKKFHIASLLVPRTKPDPTRTPTDHFLLPPTFQNDVTHWWDGSQIYGSDIVTANRLREGAGGRLKVDANGLLPKADDGFDDTGMRRNWWVGLGVMHNLFAQEHNSIAAMLAANHPDWTDQQLYDKARMINSALIVKIHTVEWTPAILPNKVLEVGMNANWYGLEKFIAWPTPGGQPIPPDAFKASLPPAFQAQWPVIKPIIYGVAGGDRDLKTNPSTGQPVPFSLTEEFVSVYRMHPLLPDTFEVRSFETGEKLADVPMADARNADARSIMETWGMRDIVYTMGTEHPGALTLRNYPKFLQELDIPLIGKFDMGTVDILRDRERGIPRYNDFRKNLRMKPVASFEELTSDPAVVAALKKVYGSEAGAINRMDALVGTLAETTRPTCYGFGETLFQVFTLMATRRIQADRFLTNDYRPEVYTQEGIDWVENNSLKTVLLRHFPELADSGLANVKNAFFPWD